MFNKKVILPLIYILAYLFTLYIVIQYVLFKPEQAGVVSSKLEDPTFPYEVWKLFFIPHIILGVISLMIGTIQLTKRSRQSPKLHKSLGRIYAAAIFLNVLVVPYLAFFSTGGRNSTLAFLVLDVIWFGTTAAGVGFILKRKIGAHRKWMLRSFATTYVFVTFRIVLALESLTTNAPSSFTFPMAVYLALAMNLGVTELYVRKKNKSAYPPQTLKGAH